MPKLLKKAKSLKKRAYTLIEVLIAAAIISVFSVLITKINTVSYNTVKNDIIYAQASYLAFGLSNAYAGATDAQIQASSLSAMARTINPNFDSISDISVAAIYSSSRRYIQVTIKGVYYTCEVPY